MHMGGGDVCVRGRVGVRKVDLRAPSQNYTLPVWRTLLMCIFFHKFPGHSATKKIASISCIGEKNSRPSTGLAHEWLRLNKNFVYLTLFSTGLKCSLRRVLVNCGIVLCFADQQSQETIEPSKLIKLSHAKKGSYTRKKFSFQKLHFYIVYWLLFLPPAKRTGLRTVKVVGRWEGDQSIDSTPKRLCFVKLLLTVNYNIAFFSHLPPIITCGKAVSS